MTRWGLINATCNFAGIADFFVFLWLSGTVSYAQLAAIVLNFVIAFPLIPATIGTLAVPRMFRFVRTLEGLAAGGPVPEADLLRSRRFYFFAPRFVALVAYTAWILVMGATFALNVARSELPIELAGFIALLGIFTAAPLAAVTTFFASDVHVRNQAARLFPDGRLASAPGRSVPLEIKGGLMLLFGAVLPQIGMAAMLADRAGHLVAQPSREGLANFQHLAAYLTVGNLFVLVLFGILMGRGTGFTVHLVTQAMKRAEDGDMDGRVVVESNDAVGYLAERFNQMLEGIRERELLRQAFGRYVSAEVAQEVLDGKLELGGERRVVTLLFSDIRDFTTLSENMAPREIVEMLNRYFARMVACVVAEGGMVNKFIGDGIMAVFGAPVAREDNAVRAVRAALRMIDELAAFNAEQRAAGNPELRIGVGMATGEVVVGNVGSEDRIEYTAIGDAVNTASRIEGLTKDAGVPILLDEETYRRVHAQFPCDSQGSRKVKGKQEPVQVYAPTR